MLVKLTYLFVIVLWATTPLAISLGGDSLPPMTSLSLRLIIALLLGSTVCTIFGYASLNIKKHWKLYLAASISLFPNMALVYWAAQFIPSGLIALLFGLSPFFFAVLAKPMLGEDFLQPGKLLAIAIASIGLLCIFLDESHPTSESYLGIGLMLISNILFSVSAIWVKKLNQLFTVEPLEQALGAMTFALPGLCITWWLVNGFEPITMSYLSLASLLYLSVCGSLIGFVAYYYILNKLSVESVSLIPLITPVLAMILGVIVNDEKISIAMYSGAGLILIALGFHQGLWFKLSKSVSRLKYPT